MLRCNSEMSKALSSLASLGSLSSDLSSIAEQGFYQKDGCTFLKFFENMITNVSLSSFVDRTGYECFINSIHVDDYAENDWLGNALQFSRRLLECWSGTSRSDSLEVILSYSEFGATVKAHVTRTGESWLSDDLDKYNEPILVVTSDGAELRELIDKLR